MVYNPVNGLFYVSVPGSAGAPLGNSIVSIDPATGALSAPLYIGSEPDRLAITSDGDYLWVGLDASGSVTRVNLTTNTVSAPFPVYGSSPFESPVPISALAALPGASNSVVVATDGAYPAIYDGGVIRGSNPATCTNCVNAIRIDSTKGEIYAAEGTTEEIYTWNSAGLTLEKTNNSSSGEFSGTASGGSVNPNDEFQVISGTLYTDFGTAYNSETGTALGTFYNPSYYSGAYPASGPSYADSSLGTIFYLDTASNTAYLYQQIQAFNLSNYSLASSPAIPITVISTSVGSANAFPSRLSRWGSNGLAFRTASAVYSVRSNSVNDLSQASADLQIGVSVSGGAVTGSNTTYTATVTNAGPSSSTNVVVTGILPSTGTLVSATSTMGSCSSPAAVVCDIGGLANGAKATITIVIQQLTSGAGTLSVSVSGSENDPVPTNNQANATATITGAAVSPVPSVVSISPSSVLAGAGITTITVNGTGFTSSSMVLAGGTPLATTFVSSTQLTAAIPSTSLNALGWLGISVSTSTAGGGTSTTLPLTVFTVLQAGANDIIYDPYTRKIMASIASNSATVAGNSIVAITPETASIGTPLAIGTQPGKLALTGDGQILYTILTGSNGIARFNMLTQQPDFTVSLSSTYNGSPSSPVDLSVQPGTENTIAAYLGAPGTAIFDFNPTTKTGGIRGQATNINGTCPRFLDSTHLLETDSYSLTSSSGNLVDLTVPSGGFATGTSLSDYANLSGFGCVAVGGGLAYGTTGGVANPGTVPPAEVGTFPGAPIGAPFNLLLYGIPDDSLGESFFIANNNWPCSPCGVPGGIAVYNQSNFLPNGTVSLSMQTIEGGSSYTAVDLVRWGQDGLAALTSSGRIYLLRGPVVTPQELNSNTPAALTSSSATSLAHGSGNTLLTLTGSNFVPGVAVTWNGNYRTTSIISPTQVTVAIPASDLALPGSAVLAATNPGASASSTLPITIN
jgi:uncharacterized repeat protein (TIGR01451 family)